MWPLTRSKPKKIPAPEGPLRDQEIWFVDGEMTGLDPKKDELLHLVAVPMREGRLILGDMYQWLVAPDKPLGEDDAVRHHHITPALLRDAIPKRQFAREVELVLDRKILMGHFVHLDYSFLSKINPIECILLDTSKLFKVHQAKLQPHFPPEHLELLRVAESLGVPAWPSHFALNDVLTCANCFLKMAHDLGEMGLRDIRDLIRLCEVKA